MEVPMPERYYPKDLMGSIFATPGYESYEKVCSVAKTSYTGSSANERCRVRGAVTTSNSSNLLGSDKCEPTQSLYQTSFQQHWDVKAPPPKGSRQSDSPVLKTRFTAKSTYQQSFEDTSEEIKKRPSHVKAKNCLQESIPPEHHQFTAMSTKQEEYHPFGVEAFCERVAAPEKQQVMKKEKDFFRFESTTTQRGDFGQKSVQQSSAVIAQKRPPVTKHLRQPAQRTCAIGTLPPAGKSVPPQAPYVFDDGSHEKMNSTSRANFLNFVFKKS